MFKIMLADDEGIVIDSLRFIIEKEFGSQCVIESAKTGRQVIELAEHFRPDIAVMDIQMPGINGIDAMREIRRTNSNIIFIIMSAYDKFDYAQEAIKLGALEYITKPMDRNKMVACLKRAMEIVETDQEKRRHELIVREKLETVAPILESGLIYDILFHEHFVEDIESYKTMLDITKDYAFMMTLVCGEAQEGNHMTNAMGSSVRLQRYYRDIREDFKDAFPGSIVGTAMANKIAVLVPRESGDLEYSERIELIEKARNMVHRFRRKMDISFRIGIGSVGDLISMSDSYREAINALIMTTGSVAHADDLPIGCEYTSDYPVNLEKRLFEEVSRGNHEAAKDVCQSYLDWLKGRDTNDIKLKCLEFVLRAEKIAYENGGMLYKFESRQSYLPDIMAMDDFDSLRDWFTGKIIEACINIQNKRKEQSVNVIEAAKDFIKDNYSKNISLEDVSKNVDVSPYYFSRIFKGDTGVNFIDYLTSVRIEKAKELLSASNYSMKEICVMVGYSDPNYFSRSFKKHVGVTPTEYKEGKSV